MPVKNVLKFFLILSSSLVLAAPWNNGIEIGTSVAQSYGSRNLFVNPAALAFEKELNGSGLLSSFTLGSTFNKETEFSLSSSYNLFGFGYEKLVSDGENYSRYQLGLSYPVSSVLFLGTRFSNTYSNAPSLSGHFSWDLGMQYRPLSYLSLGLTVSDLNQSTINGVKLPSVYTLGASFRPRNGITLSTDIETPSNDFTKTIDFQTTLALEPVNGLILNTGFQSHNRFQIGIQWDLAKASLFSMFHPSPDSDIRSGASRYTVGFQTALRPQKSFLKTPKELFITLDESLSEEGREGTFFVARKISLLDILQSIQESSDSNSIDKIVIKLEAFPLGLAAAQEIAEALINARAHGKTVEVFLTSASTKEYLIASSGTTIYLEPSGEISLLGPRISKYFTKGTLDKMGVEGEFLAQGEYKSAPETFTRKDSSLKNKEATTHELEQMNQALLDVLKRSRKVTEEKWKSWLKLAVVGSEEALKNNIIDKIGSFKEVTDSKPSQPQAGPGTFFSSRALKLPERISVITAHGNILQTRNRLLGLTGQSQIIPEEIEPLLDRALNDPRTKAIVLRVSSPGGEVLASEQIATLVEKAQKKKPVIISMGDMAASGGYFISAPGTKIFADPLTLTGSIGVFVGKFNLGALYRRLDLNKEVVGISPFAGIDSEHKAWTHDEKLLMQKRVSQYYDSFVRYVGKHRKISKDIAEKAARGRVWLGRESIALKIVDSHGGLLDAIEAAKQESGEKGDFIVYPVRETIGLVEAISETTVPSAQIKFSDVGAILGADLTHELLNRTWAHQQKYLYLAPIE